MSHRKHKLAFTLIELLVVITIIVVLLALLTPALDRAIQQAELAVCGTNYKGLGNALNLYAVGNQRRHIYRYQRIPVGTRPNLLRIGKNGDTRLDDRPLFEQYFSLDMLVDPLVDDIKLDKASNPNDPYIYIPTLMWAGWKYDGEKGMDKLGDRFTYTDNLTEPGNPRKLRFDLLASDQDWGWNDNRQIGVNHPDDEGMTALITYQDQPANKGLPAVPAANVEHTLSTWESVSGVRGTVDMHYLHGDGSVERFNKVERRDPRTKPVSIHNGQDATYSFWIPSAD